MVALLDQLGLIEEEDYIEDAADLIEDEIDEDSALLEDEETSDASESDDASAQNSTTDGSVTVVDDLNSYMELTSFDAASFFADKLSNEMMEKMKSTDNLIMQNEILTDLYSVPSLHSIDKFGKVKF